MSATDEAPLYKGLSLNLGSWHGIGRNKVESYRQLDKIERNEDADVRSFLDATTDEERKKKGNALMSKLTIEFGKFLKALAEEGYVLLLFQECPGDYRELRTFEFYLSEAGFDFFISRAQCIGVAWHTRLGATCMRTEECFEPYCIHVELAVNNLRMTVFSCYLVGYFTDRDPSDVTVLKNDEQFRKILDIADQRHSVVRSVASLFNLDKRTVTIMGGGFNSLPEHGVRSELTDRRWQVSDQQRTAQTGALDQVYMRGAGVLHSIYKESEIARKYIDAPAISLGCSDHHPYFFGFQLK